MKTMRASLLIAPLAAIVVALSALAPALAQDRHGHDDRDRGGEFRHDRGRDHDGWRDHDVRRFRDHDFAVWRGGRWFHARHEGRFGWWWVAGGTWYFYPAPIYPYPDPLVPAYATPGAPVWYFCPTAQVYYPYVPSCPVPWQVVPAQ